MPLFPLPFLVVPLPDTEDEDEDLEEIEVEESFSKSMVEGEGVVDTEDEDEDLEEEVEESFSKSLVSQYLRLRESHPSNCSIPHQQIGENELEEERVEPRESDAPARRHQVGEHVQVERRRHHGKVVEGLGDERNTHTHTLLCLMFHFRKQ